MIATTLRALCQDCLRRRDLADEAEANQAIEGHIRCKCGGELCDCEGCLHTLSELERGDRGRVTGVTAEVIGWSADEGAEFEILPGGTQ